MKPVTRPPLFRLALLFFLQPLSAALWILPFSNILTINKLGALVPIVFAFSPLAALFAPWVAGILADHKIPPERLMRYLLSGSSVTMFGAYLAVEHTNPSLILGFMFAHAVLVAPLGVLAATIVLANSSDPAKHFPFFRIWSTVAWIVAGYFISFGIASDFSPKAMVATGIGELVVALYTFLLPPAPVPQKKLIKSGWRSVIGLQAFTHLPGGLVTVLLSMVATTMFLSAAFFPYAPQLLRASGIERPSAWMTVAQWSEIVFIGCLPYFLLRVKAQWLMLIGLTCGGLRCLCFLLYAQGEGVWLALVGLAMHGPVTAFTFVTMQVFMEKNLPAEIRIRAQALVSVFGTGMGALAGLLLSGLLASHTVTSSDPQPSTWSEFWGAFALLHTVAIPVYFIILRNRSAQN